jgi:hypothetical protein
MLLQKWVFMSARSVHGCCIQIGSALQPFEAAHSFVHAVIEQKDRFVKIGLLHENIPFSGMAASLAVNVARRDTPLPLESVVDSDGQTNSVGPKYGGGYATRRQTETKSVQKLLPHDLSPGRRYQRPRTANARTLRGRANEYRNEWWPVDGKIRQELPSIDYEASKEQYANENVRRKRESFRKWVALTENILGRIDPFPCNVS